jgi:hypothetical protein
LKRAGLVAGVAATLLFGQAAPAAAQIVALDKTPTIEVHAIGVIDVTLVPLSERGTITLRLQTGTLATTGETVYFVLSDASDGEFAETFGGIRAPSLAETPVAALEDAVFENGQWTFFTHPGTVTHFDANGDVVPPVNNPDYSPLKRITWQGRTVIVNVPFVRWGDDPGEQIIVDQGGCSPLIRKNAPSPFFVGGGPFDGGDCTNEGPLDRYKGGQAVNIDLVNLTVTMKLHKSWYSWPGKLPHYTVFEHSKAPPAGFTGTIWAPKLANVGRFGTGKAAGRIHQFSNGLRVEDGGPNRFQPGNVSYTGGMRQTYSPMWHIGWVFYDCDQDGVFFGPYNVGEGDVPVPGSGIPGFDPLVPETFDPFQMDDKGVACLDVVNSVIKNGDAGAGVMESIHEVEDLDMAGLIVFTEGPPGLRQDSTLQPQLEVNCPAPVTVHN